jgi:hypothetical protein
MARSHSIACSSPDNGPRSGVMSSFVRVSVQGRRPRHTLIVKNYPGGGK